VQPLSYTPAHDDDPSARHATLAAASEECRAGCRLLKQWRLGFASHVGVGAGVGLGVGCGVGVGVGAGVGTNFDGVCHFTLKRPATLPRCIEVSAYTVPERRLPHVPILVPPFQYVTTVPRRCTLSWSWPLGS